MSYVRFPRVGRLHRGYQCSQVDAFFARCEHTLDGGVPLLSAADIRRAGFELVRHGYEPAAVDAALDAMEERALAAQPLASGRRGRLDLGSEVEFLRRELSAPYMRRFRRAGAFRRGYEIDEVDEFVDRVAEALAGNASLTVEDVRTAVFHPKWGGYDENAVDDALDRVVELLLLLHRETSTPAQPPGVPKAAAPPA